MTYIHGATDSVETARLEKQARFLSRWILDGFDVGPGARLLDLACGVGAMARRLRARFPDAHMVGSDLSMAQLRAARSFTSDADGPIPWVNADASRLPFRSAAFDAVHCSWLLEHVPQRAMVPILSEARRVLKPGGVAQFTEVENESLAFWPRLPLVEDLARALWKAQQDGGGDPIVGRKLYGLAMQAGFRDVQVLPHTFHLHAGSPYGYFRGVLEEFAEILESAQDTLKDPLAERIPEAARMLRDLQNVPGSSFTYTFFRARGRN
ncbi:MAG: class I SAM-dependent methyltransferase [Deltaproteobacteria bacterium]|nr:class I SAM-dependent methyltransferase [Deltaproteobacteria bacterium]